ncbi:MAG: GNAT family N-acetyltransferase [Nitrospinota bacterium]|nr:MAG: GNAT family N-acetyltransferase [Nitrospinota bacterium]
MESTPRNEEHLPAGKLKTIVTYLEMRSKPSRKAADPPSPDFTIMRAVRPTISFYRYLYNTVGEPWLWGDRRKLSDEELGAIVQHPAVEVYVLYVAGVPAGYVELDLRQPPDIELAYFGLMPEFIGQGWGRFLLDWAIDKAWSYNPRRLWLHTCNLDHPRALSVYQRAGFVPYKEEIEIVDDPRALGLM